MSSVGVRKGSLGRLGRRALIAGAIASLSAAAWAAVPRATGERTVNAPTVCRHIRGCRIQTLPPMVIREGRRVPFRLPAAPVPSQLSGIISPDTALAIAWDEDAQPDADQREVILAAPDPNISWAPGHPLVYFIVWTDVCIPDLSGNGLTEPTCLLGQWETVIDAYTGEFIIGGGDTY